MSVLVSRYNNRRLTVSSYQGLFLRPSVMIRPAISSSAIPTHKLISPRKSFEYLPRRPLIRLAVHLDRLIPGPLVVDVLLILYRVKLLKLVGFPVGSDVKGWHSFIATDEEDALDDGVIAHAIDRHGAEEILAGCFETGEETT